MVVSRRVAWFLLAFGVWSWVIWPTFLKNIWHDPRSWHHGMTGFFAVHLALTIVSLLLGTTIGVLGIRALLSRRPRSFAGADLPTLTADRQTDAGLSGDLERRTGDTARDLDPL